MIIYAARAMSRFLLLLLLFFYEKEYISRDYYDMKASGVETIVSSSFYDFFFFLFFPFFNIIRPDYDLDLF